MFAFVQCIAGWHNFGPFISSSASFSGSNQYIVNTVSNTEREIC